MTNRELVAELRQMPPDAEVRVETDAHSIPLTAKDIQMEAGGVSVWVAIQARTY